MYGAACAALCAKPGDGRTQARAPMSPNCACSLQRIVASIKQGMYNHDRHKKARNDEGMLRSLLVTRRQIRDLQLHVVANPSGPKKG